MNEQRSHKTKSRALTCQWTENGRGGDRREENWIGVEPKVNSGLKKMSTGSDKVLLVLSEPNAVYGQTLFLCNKPVLAER